MRSDDELHAQHASAGTGTTRSQQSADGLFSPPRSPHWDASLRLEFAPRRSGTTLTRSLHEGPLRVQRAFYPEGESGPCHVYVLHPPGGVVSGDRLLIDVDLAPRSQVLLTAPGANKLYRARVDTSASLTQRFTVGDGGCLEWLPPETIAFDGTNASIGTQVRLHAGATYAGWEILCLGRPAARERLTHGQVKTELSVARDEQLVYVERGRYRGGDALLEAPWGMSGQPVLGTFLIASPRAEQSWVEQVREHVSSDGKRFAVTLVSGVVIVRYLGDSTREARELFERCYRVLRPLYAGLAAVNPRIWST